MMYDCHCLIVHPASVFGLSILLRTRSGAYESQGDQGDITAGVRPLEFQLLQREQRSSSACRRRCPAQR